MPHTRKQLWPYQYSARPQLEKSSSNNMSTGEGNDWNFDAMHPFLGNDKYRPNF